MWQRVSCGELSVEWIADSGKYMFTMAFIPQIVDVRSTSGIIVRLYTMRTLNQRLSWR